MKQPIVIIGGGFAGLRAALDLDQRYGDDLTAPIFLVDPSPCHIYTPSLYELTSVVAPRIATIPFEEIIDGTNIRFIQERVVKVDLELKQVITERRRLKYTDLVLALGSQCRALAAKKRDGMSRVSIKTLDDILSLRHQIATCFTDPNQTKDIAPPHFLVAGAGPTGVEFAAGLNKYRRQLASQLGASGPGIKISLVEASDRILSRFPPRLGAKVQKYLKGQGVTISVKTTMKPQGSSYLKMNQEKLLEKQVIWTVGTQPHELIGKIKGLCLDDRGHVLVDAGLQAIAAPRVWVAGDIVAMKDAGMADAAIAHGRHIASAIAQERQGKIAPAYFPKQWPLVLPLSSNYGVAMVGDRIIEGPVVIWYKDWRVLKYFFSILPPISALKLWLTHATIDQDKERVRDVSPAH